MSSLSNRVSYIDSWRGIACILLVAYHVVGFPDAGLRIESGIYRDLNDTLAYIRMPLFTFLSGFVYSYRPFDGQFPLFLKGKVRRLLIPMLILGTIFAVLQSLTPGANKAIVNWTTLHIIPVAHFWFIESLFIVFMMVALLEVLKLLKTPYAFLAVFLAAVALHVSDLEMAYFSISGVLYLFPYFLLGLFVHRFSIYEYIKPIAGYALMASALLIITYIVISDTELFKNRSIFALAIGTLFCIGAVCCRLEIGLFSFIGVYSYSIYLFHAFFTAASRIIWQKLGVFDINILFILGVVLGLSGPMIAEAILAKFNITRVLFLGKGFKKSTSEKKLAASNPESK